MNFRSLDASLIPTAEAAASHFRSTHGAKSFEAEAEVDPRLRYRPTLMGTTRDFHSLCVEVTEGTVSQALDAFVLDTVALGLPVRLWIAVPAAVEPAVLGDLMVRAKNRGLGVIQMNGAIGSELTNPVSLSLYGLRTISRRDYPSRYRQALGDAESTFRAGDPAKGCSRMFDELEALTRRIAKRISKRGFWKIPPTMNLDTAPWSKVVEAIRDMSDRQTLKALSPGLNDAMLGSLIGVTPQRNESGHKPSTRSALIKRDQQLRTRFESAADLLLELIRASNPLRP